MQTVNAGERQQRLEFLQFTDDDRAVLAEMHPLFLERQEEFLDAFYGHLMKFEGTRRVLKDEATIKRARRGQAQYMERMLLGQFDEEFFSLSIQVGLKHQEIGLEPAWVVGAWDLYLSYWTERLFQHYESDPRKAIRCIQALHKVILLALGLGVDAYYAKTLERVQQVVANQKRAIMELSTPVIQIWEGVLVLPLIGAIDQSRTRQIMENLLTKVVDTQSEVVIIDVTGVPVVDTSVANHLMNTVEAARLLGTRCILTGISPAIAQTLVHLGVDMSQVTTTASLKKGLQHALQQLGLGIGKLNP